MKKTGKDVLCPMCGKEFHVAQWSLDNNRGKYCSVICYGKSLSGKPPWNKGLVGLGSGENNPRWKGGFPNCSVCGKKLSRRGSTMCYNCLVITRSFRGKNHPLWKERDFTNTALHQWVYRELGRPSKCEFCGFVDESGRLLEWANKSRKYKRDISDWIRLCRKCHHNYDNKSKKMVETKRRNGEINVTGGLC